MPTTPIATFTEQEAKAQNLSRDLLKMSVANDNIPKEVFDATLDLYNAVTQICIDARRVRTPVRKKAIRIFRRKK